MSRTNYPNNPAPVGRPREFLEEVATRPGVECVLWPFWKSPTGYARIMWNGKREGAYRAAWEVRNGQEWPAGAEAIHLCHEPSCVNPLHVRPGSHHENVRHTVRSGRGHTPERKLKYATVVEILFRLYRGDPMRKVAKDFELSLHWVGAIWNRRAWKHVIGPRSADTPRGYAAHEPEMK